MYSGDFELMTWDWVDLDILNSIPYYRDSSLVQKAVEDKTTHARIGDN
ncbi:hypothetical protein CLOSTHATH_05624 [Hungatella hathewayi DSM 13479]|jgi:hypothetical protein|uniref:Uncharacterized protein n=1 Tax=Hungatella hathewayi DSM 13479 TaxID=566550 RepID=D3APS0_9FIRM|nr:hypothetical protein CLOSTHATH_05624 [Hungatella hathewayi DSM 13479]